MEAFLKEVLSNGNGKTTGPASGLGDMNKLAGHAQKIWSFLDDLAEKDPKGYTDFIHKQAASAGVDMQAKKPEVPKSPLVIVTKVNKPTAYKSKGITINVWKASADITVTTKDSLVVDASGMEEVENFRDLTIPIEEKGKLKLDHADCKRMATSHIQVPVAAVNCALLPHHQFRPYLVEYVTRFVEAKYNVLLDREARKLMVLTDAADEKEAKESKTHAQQERAKQAAEGTSASNLPVNLLEELSSIAISQGDSCEKKNSTGLQARNPAAKSNPTNSEKFQAKHPLIQEINSSENKE